MSKRQEPSKEKKCGSSLLSRDDDNDKQRAALVEAAAVTASSATDLATKMSENQNKTEKCQSTAETRHINNVAAERRCSWDEMDMMKTVAHRSQQQPSEHVTTSPIVNGTSINNPVVVSLSTTNEKQRTLQASQGVTPGAYAQAPGVSGRRHATPRYSTLQRDQGRNTNNNTNPVVSISEDEREGERATREEIDSQEQTYPDLRERAMARLAVLQQAGVVSESSLSVDQEKLTTYNDRISSFRNHLHFAEEAPGAIGETKNENNVVDSSATTNRITLQSSQDNFTSIRLNDEPEGTTETGCCIQSRAEKLVEARPVLGLSSKLELVQADEVDLQSLQREQRRKRHDQRKKKMCRLVGVVAMVLAVIAVIAVSVSLTKSKNNDDNMLVPTVTLSVAPTSIPTMAPSAPLELLLNILPQDTLRDLQNATTPQWRAMDWLESHPNLIGQNMSLSRQTQLFALATFAFSMHWGDWPTDIKERWLDYDRHECLWFSTMFGFFENGSYAEWGTGGLLIDGTCNDRGEFRALLMGSLNLSNKKATVPREIALLNLTHFGLGLSDFGNTTMAELFPPELFTLDTLKQFYLLHTSVSGKITSQLSQLSNLSVLHLEWNQFTGTIPSSIYSLTQLESLSLFGNQMLSGTISTEIGMLSNLEYLLDLEDSGWSGSIPTELGLLTHLETLYLGYNALTNNIPSEFGQLTSTSLIYLQNNNLSGSIPEEVGLLVDSFFGSLVDFSIADNSMISGTIPEELCSLTLSNFTYNCTDILCGCDCLCLNKTV